MQHFKNKEEIVMKKKLLALGMAAAMLAGCLTACGNDSGSAGGGGGWTPVQEFTYKDIASWGSMQTPSEGSGAGSIAATNDADGYVTIQAASDGWGGVESGYFGASDKALTPWRVYILI